MYARLYPYYGRERQLNFCFRMQVTCLKRVDFILLTTRDGCCLGIRFDGVVVSATGPGVGAPSSALIRH
ncbi:hypothetical protein Pvag_pPag20050 (plasmid) [Pantoea vagans C9-1]|nr:hypothetical protein Pvag_pPag20050 [Pantoea vagans C9-1]